MLSPVDWTYIKQRPHHLACRLSREASVVWMDPVGLRGLALRDLPRIYRRLTRPATVPAGADACGHGVRVVSPSYIPLPGVGAARWLNRRHFFPAAAAAALAAFPTPTIDVLWIGAPSTLAVWAIEHSLGRVVAYDCMDDYPSFFDGVTRARVAEQEADILARADIVFASASSLADRMRPFTSAPCEVLPNGIHLDLFRTAPPGGRPRPPSTSRPGADGRLRVGYVGTIGPWLDFDLLNACARRLPSADFILVGPDETDGRRGREREPNVHIRPRVPHRDVPAIIRSFDVCVVPFRITELTRHVSPLKVMEYLAAGRPVVSTPLPMLADMAPFVTIREDVDDFAEAIIAAGGCRGQVPTGMEPDVERALVDHDWATIADAAWGRLAPMLSRG